MIRRAIGWSAACGVLSLLPCSAWGGTPESPSPAPTPAATATARDSAQDGGASAAEPAADPAEAERRAAYQRHFDAGVRLHDAGKYDAALLEFEAAYAAEAAPAPLVNMALCYERIDSPTRPHPTAIPAAVAKLRQVLTEHGASLPADRRAAIETKLASLTPLIGLLQLDVKPASARVTLGSVTLEGSDAGKPIEVRSGTWPLRAEAEGFAPADRRLEITSGATTTVHLALEATAGELVVEPAAEDSYVEVDRGSIQQGRWRGMLSPGSHEVRVFRAGGAVHTIEVAVLAGRSYRIAQSADGELHTNAPTMLDPSAPAGEHGETDPAAPEEAATTGFEVLATSAILVAMHRKSIEGKFNWVSEHQPVGVCLGLRGGYRAVDWLGFLLGIEYGATWGDGTVAPKEQLQAKLLSDTAANYTLHSWRLTGGLRAVLPPDADVRFVGEATTGVVLASIVWDTNASGDQGDHYFDDTTGLDFLVGLDVGLEVDLGGLLLDLVVQNWLQTTRGLKAEGAPSSAFDNSLVWFIGPAIRPGFKFF